MKYYPSAEDFNMHSVDGRALYLAHCDLDPILALIEHTKIALDLTIDHLGEEAETASDNGDMRAESDIIDLMTTFSGQVSSLSYEAILLILISRLEEAMNIWCRMIWRSNKELPEPKKGNSKRDSGALEKAVHYLNDYANITSIKEDKAWEEVTAIRDARNMIVHNGGRVKEEKRHKLEKHAIGMRKEDYSVYIDYDALKKMYNTIIMFCDRVFNLRGLAFPDNN